MQLYFVVASIFERHGQEIQLYYERIQASPKDVSPCTPIELMLEQNFVPFLLRYIDSRQHLSVIASNQVAEMLESWGIRPTEDESYDLTNLTQEQYLHFRSEFVEERNHNQSWCHANN